VAQNRNALQKRARGALDRARGPHLSDLLPKTDYSDESIRAIVANLVLTLSDGPNDAPLRAAFKEAELDPLNPHHWRRLLNIFAEIHFPSPAKRAPAKRGAPKKWDFEQFDRHVEWARARTNQFLKRRGEPGPTHNDVALYLKIALPQHYGKIEQATLRSCIIKRQKKGEIIRPLIGTI
jgi:hypothetical protein